MGTYQYSKRTGISRSWRGSKSGVSFPKFENLSKAFGFPYSRAENHDQMKEAIKATLEKMARQYELIHR